MSDKTDLTVEEINEIENYLAKTGIDNHSYQKLAVIFDQARCVPKLREWNRKMVEKAASGGVLDGYREMGQRINNLEQQLAASAQQVEQMRGALEAMLEDFGLYSHASIKMATDALASLPPQTNEPEDEIPELPDGALEPHEFEAGPYFVHCWKCGEHSQDPIHQTEGE